MILVLRLNSASEGIPLRSKSHIVNDISSPSFDKSTACFHRTMMVFPSENLLADAFYYQDILIEEGERYPPNYGPSPDNLLFHMLKIVVYRIKHNVLSP